MGQKANWLLVAGALLIFAWGCQSASETTAQQDSDLRSIDPIQSSNGSVQQTQVFSTQAGYSDLFDLWEETHVDAILMNAQTMEQKYLELLRNPPVHPVTGELIEITPRSSFWYPRPKSSNGKPPRVPDFLLLNPAVSSFTYHVSNRGKSGLIGRISVEQARVRLAIADLNVEAMWVFYRKREDSTKQIEPHFTDVVDAPALSFEDRKKFTPLAKTAFESEDGRTKGTVDGWTFETRPLTFFDTTCITCHPKREIGDVAGISLYMARPASSSDPRN